MAEVGPSGDDYYVKLDDATVSLGGMLPFALARDMLGQRYVGLDVDIYNPAIGDVIGVYDISGTSVATLGSDVPGGMSSINGIALDQANGWIYAADSDNNRIVRLSLATGAYVDSFGAADGLTYPMGVAVDMNGDVWVTDSYDATDPEDGYAGRILRFDSAGQLETTINGFGTGNSTPFSWPNGITTDPDGYVYVADGNSDYPVHRFTFAGAWTDSIPAVTAAGTLTSAQDVEVDAFGTVYVLYPDSMMRKIVRFDNNFQYMSTAVDVSDVLHPENVFDFSYDILVDPYMDIHLADMGDDLTGHVYTYDWHSANDQAPPTTTHNIPDAWRTGPYQVQLSATDTSSTVTSIYYSTDGNDPSVGQRGSSASFDVTAEGTTTVKFFAVDSAGNHETVQSKFLRLDNTPPVVTTDATATVYYEQATVHFSATDALSGVSKVEWQLGNGQVYEGNTALIGVTNGIKDLKFQGFDLAGNATQIYSIPITVRPTDDSPPTTYCNTPDNTWQTSDTTVTLNAVDPVLSDGSPGEILGTYYTLDGGSRQTYSGGFPITQEGTHTLSFWSVDTVGNSETTKTITIKLDKTFPVTGSDVLSSYIGSATVTLSPSDAVSGVQTTYWRLNSVPGSGNIISINATGTHILEFWSRDNAGNTEVLKRYTLSVYPIDTNPPNVYSDLPPEGWVPGASGVATVTLTAQDDVTGLKAVYWQIDGGTIQSEVLTATENDPPVRLLRIKFPLATGVHSLTFWGMDVRGNTGAPRVETARIDPDPPVTTSNVQPTYVGTATITFSASDPLSGVMQTTYRYRPSGGGNWTQANGTSLQVSAWGAYDLEYWSVDSAGNTELTHSSSFVVASPDVDPPVTTWHGTTGWVKGSATVDLRATDTSSSVKDIFWSTDGQTWYTYSAPFFVSAQGVTTIRYYAVDVYNNVEDQQQHDVMVDNVSPTTTSDTQSSYVDTATITLTPTDSASGVQSTWWRLYNGNSWTTPATGTVVTKAYDYRTFTLQWWSYDAVGNKEATQSATFRIRWRDSAFENTDPDLIFRDGWTLQPSGSASAGSYHRAETSGSVSFLYFQGSELSWYGPTGTAWGKARVTVDDGTPTIVDCYNPAWTTNHNEQIWSTGLLPFGYHSVKIEALGDKHASSSSTQVGIDRFYGEASLLPVPDTAAPITTASAPSGWVANSATVTLSATDATTGVAAIYAAVDAQPSAVNTYTAPITVSSPGTHTVSFYAVDKRGNAEVTKSVTIKVDPTPPVTSSNAQPSYLQTATINLSASDAYSGVQTTRWRVDGGSWSTGTVVTVPDSAGEHAVEYYSIDSAGITESTRQISVAIMRRFEESAPELGYFGTWETQGDGSFSASALKRTATPGGTLYVAFTGTAIDWYTYKYFGAGIASISVDGGPKTEFDLYSSSPSPKAKIWGVTGLASGTHLLKIEYTGRKHTAAASAWVSADFFDVAGTLVPAWPVADAVAPSTSATAPAGWSTSDATVSLSASDALSGVARTYYRVNAGAQTTYTASFQVSTEGTNTISFWSVDLAGNAETPKSITVRVDKTAPSTTDNASPDWSNSAPLVTLTPADAVSGPASVAYSLNGGDTLLYTSPISVTAEGTTTIRYWAYDLAGNAETPKTALVHYDITPPVTSCDASTAWTPGPVPVTFDSIDALSGTALTFASVDGGSAAPVIGELMISGEGTHTVEYRSVDAAGNSETTKTATVRIDDTAPATTDDAPTDWVRGPVTVTLDAFDEHSGISATLISVDGADGAAYEAPLAFSAEGTHTIAYASTDVAGNVESTKTATVRIDDTAPVTTATVASSYLTTATIPLVAADALSGVDSTEWRLDGGAWQSGDLATISFALGGHTLEWRSTDAAGNLEETHSARVWFVTRTDLLASGAYISSGWATQGDGSMIGNSYLYTMGAGRRVSVDFVGTRLDWIAPKSTNYGTARVFVDGVDAGVVDLYRSSYQNRNIIFSTGELAEGLHHVRIETLGLAGAGSGTQVIVDAFDVAGTFQPADVAAPVTTSNAPATWVDHDVTVALSAADSSTVKATYVSIGGSALSTYTAPIPVTAEGTTTLSYYSVDSAGNIETTKTALVRIDRVAPVTTDNAPADWSKSAVALALTVSDASGQTTTRYRINGGEESVYAAPLQISANGTTTVEYRSVDAAGNSETTKTATVLVDSVAPSSETSLAASYTATVTVSISATDSLSGLAYTQWRVDGGTWTTGTVATVPNVPGKRTLEVRSFDRAGNVEAARAYTTLIIARFDQADTNVSFRGAWATINDDSMTGKSYRTTTAGGLVLNTAFVGNRIDWIGPMSDSYGQARVILDGVDRGTVDQYRATYANNRVVWSSGVLADGEHTLTIETLGTSRVGSNGTRIVVDAFDVAGTLAPRTIDEANDIFGWSRDWAYIPDQSMTGGGYRTTTTTGAATDIAFVGTGIRWVAPKADYFGQARVYLDGALVATPDLYRSSYLNKQIVWDSGVLTDGAHTLRIVATGTGNTAATGTRVTVDALQVRGVMTSYTYDQADPNIGFDGSWATVNDPNMVGGTYRTTTATGAVVNVAFTGKALEWIAPMSSDYGQARIYIDGVDYGTVDQYRASYANAQVVWRSPTLTYGTHYVKIQVLGTAQAGVKNHRIVVDAFRITAGTPTLWRYDSEESRVTTTAGWVRFPDDNMFGRAYYQTAVPGTNIYASFNGTKIEWIAPMSINYGKANVYLDGVFMTTVDQYRSPYANRQIVWSSGTLSSGPHTLRIEVLGQRNGASTGNYVVVDAFDVAGVLVSADVLPPVTSASVQSRYDTSATIVLAPTDKGSGINATYYRVDAGNWTTGTVVSVLAQGSHTLQYYSVDKAGNTEATRTASFTVVEREDDASALLRWNLPWVNQADPNMAGGGYHFTSNAGASVEATFAGNRIEWIAPKSPDTGIVSIYLDGVLVQTVDQYAPSYVNRQIVWDSGLLADGLHTLRIVTTGTKRTESTGYKTIIDCFDVQGTNAGLRP